MDTRKIDPELEGLIQENLRIQTELEHQVEDIEFEKDGRREFGLTLIQHAHGIAESIGFLLRNCRAIAACTLLRPLFESYARAIWLLHCASDEQLTDIQNDTAFPRLQEAIGAIEICNLEDSQWFQKEYDTRKASFHSLTHGGMAAIWNSYDESNVQPNVPIEDQVELMYFVNEITRRGARELRNQLPSQ